jgi:hypothetical protein
MHSIISGTVLLSAALSGQFFSPQFLEKPSRLIQLACAANIPVNPPAKLPESFGMILFPGFELLDIGGPLEALNVLARHRSNDSLTLSLISKTMAPVAPGPIAPSTLSLKFGGKEDWMPTHTVDNAPDLGL